MLKRFYRRRRSGAAVDTQKLAQYPAADALIPTAPVWQIEESQSDIVERMGQILGPREYEWYCQRSVRNYLEYVHLLPASESHHHRGIGGMARHGLEVAAFSALMAEGVEFPTRVSEGQKISLRSHWLIAAFHAGLMHDLGKLLVDMTVISACGRHIWDPITDLSLAHWAKKRRVKEYTVIFRTNREHGTHEIASPLLAKEIIPPDILTLIKSINPDVMIQMMNAISGLDRDGPLGNVVMKADRHSTKQDLATNVLTAAPTSRKTPLDLTIADALRAFARSEVTRGPKTSPFLLVEEMLDEVHTNTGEKSSLRLFGDLDAVADIIQAHARTHQIKAVPRDPWVVFGILADRGIIFVDENDNGQYRQELQTIPDPVTGEQVYRIEFSDPAWVLGDELNRWKKHRWKQSHSRAAEISAQPEHDGPGQASDHSHENPPNEVTEQVLDRATEKEKINLHAEKKKSDGSARNEASENPESTAIEGCEKNGVNHDKVQREEKINLHAESNNKDLNAESGNVLAQVYESVLGPQDKLSGPGQKTAEDPLEEGDSSAVEDATVEITPNPERLERRPPPPVNFKPTAKPQTSEASSCEPETSQEHPSGDGEAEPEAALDWLEQQINDLADGKAVLGQSIVQAGTGKYQLQKIPQVHRPALEQGGLIAVGTNRVTTKVRQRINEVVEGITASRKKEIAQFTEPDPPQDEEDAKEQLPGSDVTKPPRRPGRKARQSKPSKSKPAPVPAPAPSQPNELTEAADKEMSEFAKLVCQFLIEKRSLWPLSPIFEDSGVIRSCSTAFSGLCQVRSRQGESPTRVKIALSVAAGNMGHELKVDGDQIKIWKKA